MRQDTPEWERFAYSALIISPPYYRTAAMQYAHFNGALYGIEWTTGGRMHAHRWITPKRARHHWRSCRFPFAIHGPVVWFARAICEGSA